MILRVARRLGLEKVHAVRRSELYFLRGNIAPGELELLGRFLLSDPLTQSFETASCPIPDLPGSVWAEMGALCQRAYESLTGESFMPGSYPVETWLGANLSLAGVRL